MVGYLSKMETMGLVDGPGIRIVFFLQGCPLRCKFCHNPEMWEPKKAEFKMTPEEVLEKILRYRPYFGKEGGATFSGGEPLLQSEFLLETLKLCKKEGIHTCLDTSGYGTHIDEILSYTDLVLLDVKGLNEPQYQEMTGVSIKPFLHFLDRCEQLQKKVWIRQVILPGINDQKEHVKKLKQFLRSYRCIEKIELLPYHTMGVNKYEQLKIPYPLTGMEAMDAGLCEALEKELREDV